MIKYTITVDDNLVTIRRGSKRHPIEKYKHFRHDPVEMAQYVRRLNSKLDGYEKIQIKHAFISPDLQDKYRLFLHAQITNKITANCEYGYVLRYFLNYFINTEKLNDPLDWFKNHKTGWANYLLKLDLAPSTKKQIIYASNKFMKWLSEERREVPLMKFQPISVARFKEIRATRKMNKEERQTNYIPEKDWNLIVTSAPKELEPIINLCYHFGLRRGEAMGLKLSDVRKGHLLVERQLIKIGVYGPNKGRIARKVPYWFSDPNTAYKWVSQIKEMHPRTLAAIWDKHVETYNLHDLRHTWITRAMRAYNPRDVQMASGHVNIQTTMGYLHDDRDLDNEQYKPAS